MRALRNILVVEDNPADVYLLRAAFQEMNVETITVACDGEEATRLLAQDSALPDLVVLDLNVPRKSGLELLAEMKSSARLQSIPVVVLSSSRYGRDLEQASTLQASAFLTKPADLDEYLALGKRITALWLELNKKPV